MTCILRAYAHLFLGASIVELRRIIASRWTALNEGRRPMPPLLAIQLLVSGEDHRNGRHSGIDVRAIARAIWRTYVQRRREGGSTIEQQLVRVLTGRFERTIRRKVREILLAVVVAHEFEKRLLATLYLDAAYYGWHMNGFAQACHRLAITPAHMDLLAAAGLVARLKYPQP
jgi:transglycosylase